MERKSTKEFHVIKVVFSSDFTGHQMYRHAPRTRISNDDIQTRSGLLLNMGESPRLESYSVALCSPGHPTKTSYEQPTHLLR